MTIFKFIPLTFYLLLSYFLIFMIHGESSDQQLAQILWQLNLFSGAVFSLSLNGLLLILSSIFLFIEILKSTRTNNASIIDHMLSMMVFIGFLVIFITMKGAANEAYFVVMLMSFIDVIAGFTITITSSRKDFNLQGGGV